MNREARVHAGRIHHSKTYWLSVVTLIGIFVVNTLGFTDTVTGSAMGCGRNWPLCNGQLVPSAWNTAVVIEYTHRISVLVGGFLLIALSIAAWRTYGHSRRVRFLVILSLLGVLLEGGLGALAVLFVNPPAIMATHMGFALFSLVGAFLLTSVIGQADRQASLPRADALPIARGALRSFTRLVWWSIPYGYVAIYVGAYVASTGDGGMFQGWPIPTESPATVGPAFWVDILHRTVALGYLALMIWQVRLAYRYRVLRPRWLKASWAALLFVCLQAFSGALLIFTHLSVYAFLIHVTNVSILFSIQCYLGLEVLVERQRPARSEGDSPPRLRLVKTQGA